MIIGHKGRMVSHSAAKKSLQRCQTQFGFEVDIVERAPGQDWQIMPKRWIVERTFAWLGNYRRLSEDYEILPDSEISYMGIAFIPILFKRNVKLV